MHEYSWYFNKFYLFILLPKNAYMCLYNKFDFLLIYIYFSCVTGYHLHITRPTKKFYYNNSFFFIISF